MKVVMMVEKRVDMMEIVRVEMMAESMAEPWAALKAIWKVAMMVALSA